MREEVHALAAGARAPLAADVTFRPRDSRRQFRVHATDHAIALLESGLCNALSAEAPDCTLRFLPIQIDDAFVLRQGSGDLAFGVLPKLPEDFHT